jgi:hypothetical protein
MQCTSEVAAALTRWRSEKVNRLCDKCGDSQVCCLWCAKQQGGECGYSTEGRNCLDNCSRRKSYATE